MLILENVGILDLTSVVPYYMQHITTLVYDCMWHFGDFGY